MYKFLKYSISLLLYSHYLVLYTKFSKAVSAVTYTLSQSSHYLYQHFPQTVTAYLHIYFCKLSLTPHQAQTTQ